MALFRETEGLTILRRYCISAVVILRFLLSKSVDSLSHSAPLWIMRLSMLTMYCVYLLGNSLRNVQTAFFHLRQTSSDRCASRANEEVRNQGTLSTISI